MQRTHFTVHCVYVINKVPLPLTFTDKTGQVLFQLTPAELPGRVGSTVCVYSLTFVNEFQCKHTQLTLCNVN